MTGRRTTFVPLLVIDREAIAEATRLYNSALAWADANDLEEVMVR
jgi:hypothetical protein